MNDKSPQYLRDVHSYIEQVPFGDVHLIISRKEKKTVQIDTYGKETLRYVDNDEAIRDMENLVRNLVASGFNGKASLELEMKDGNIQIVSIFDTKQTKY